MPNAADLYRYVGLIKASGQILLASIAFNVRMPPANRIKQRPWRKTRRLLQHKLPVTLRPQVDGGSRAT